MRQNSEIRAEARAALGGNIFSGNWLVALVAIILVTIANSILSYIPLGVIFVGPLTVGLAYFFLTILRKREKADLALLGFAFKGSDRFVRTLLVGILSWIFTFLWMLLFIIPGIVKSYAYALAPYIAAEREELDARACIDESQRLMSGHKMQLFLLDLSFVGWFLVGFLCCGIGIYFAMPYGHAARAAFYCELVADPNAGNDEPSVDFNGYFGEQTAPTDDQPEPPAPKNV